MKTKQQLISTAEHFMRAAEARIAEARSDSDRTAHGRAARKIVEASEFLAIVADDLTQLAATEQD